jgi:hypothetical protein
VKVITLIDLVSLFEKKGRREKELYNKYVGCDVIFYQENEQSKVATLFYTNRRNEKEIRFKKKRTQKNKEPC